LIGAKKFNFNSHQDESEESEDEEEECEIYTSGGINNTLNMINVCQIKHAESFKFQV
jgi:hypothetical protein